MIGLEIGTIVHYSVQRNEAKYCLPAIVVQRQDGEDRANLTTFDSVDRLPGWMNNVPYMDRDGGHPDDTWHWIHGHNTMQGCRPDLDDPGKTTQLPNFGETVK